MLDALIERERDSSDRRIRAALAEIENEAGDYRRIAERRVRLGLLLSEIGAANGVDVSDQEMRNLIAYGLNDAWRHTAMIDLSSYPGDIEVA